MAKEATVQVRMDADLKESVEALYKSMGTSFAEAVRIFARQSVTEQGMPFIVTTGKKSAYGMLEKYATPELIAQESGAFEKAVVNKYADAD